MLYRNRVVLVCLVFAALLAGACSSKSVPAPKAYSGPPCQDVLSLPQDLSVYAEAAPSGAAVSPQEQMASAERQKEALFRPWRLQAPTRWVKQALGKNFNMRGEGAYTDNKQPFPASVWEELVANSNKSAYGVNAGPGITLRHSSLRAMPTAMRYYLRPHLPGEGYPFDYFQHTSIAPGTPVYICNVSKDGLWLLVESAPTSGWIPAQDVAGVDEAFMERWQSMSLAALVADRVRLGDVAGNIGTLLPQAEQSPPGAPVSAVYVPVRGTDGKARMERVSLGYGEAVAVPMPLHARTVAEVGGKMMGQRYTWGGLDDGRDCSALTRDLFAPFGVYLPRNSSSQAKVGRVIPLAGLSNEAKEAAIVSSAVPFSSLIWLPGHIGVYLGQYQGKAVFFHNMWGLRIKDAQGGCDGRAVVGKAVVTSLRPGAERPDLCSPGSFLDRIERAVVLPQ